MAEITDESIMQERIKMLTDNLLTKCGKDAVVAGDRRLIGDLVRDQFEAYRSEYSSVESKWLKSMSDFHAATAMLKEVALVTPLDKVTKDRVDAFLAAHE